MSRPYFFRPLTGALLELILSLFISSWAVADPPAATYSFTVLDVPGTIDDYPTSINNSGQVAGYYFDRSGEHGFVYSNGTFTTLDAPDVTSTYATSINDRGQVAGSYRDRSGEHGFVYSNGTFTTLDVPGAVSTRAASINNSGQVAGSYSDGSRNHGFVYSNGTFTTLDAPGVTSTEATSINDRGQVAGSYSDSSRTHGFVYSNGTFTTLDVPGAAGYTYATSINDSGQVAGFYYDGSGNLGGTNGFVYSNGTFTTFDGPGPFAYYATFPNSINASGQVTGSLREGGEGRPVHGFVYSNGTFTTLDPPGATFYSGASSINDRGQVVGSYSDDPRAPIHGFIATPVCVAPTVTVHTLTTAPNSGFRITGSIALDSIPLCALVLANGQFMFTCGDPLPKGDFDLTVPPDEQGQITLFGFSSGLAPFQQTLGAGSLPASVNGCATPTVTHTVTTGPHGGLRITGSITLGGAPLCALVLANGQFMFTCGDALPEGNFDLTVPLDDQGQITLFGFSSDLAPFQQTFSPSPPTSP